MLTVKDLEYVNCAPYVDSKGSPIYVKQYNILISYYDPSYVNITVKDSSYVNSQCDVKTWQILLAGLKLGSTRRQIQTLLLKDPSSVKVNSPRDNSSKESHIHYQYGVPHINIRNTSEAVLRPQYSPRLLY